MRGVVVQKIVYSHHEKDIQMLCGDIKMLREQGEYCFCFSNKKSRSGKSTVMQEAAKFMSSRGEKVLLMDADLFEPTLTYRYNQENSIGLIERLDEIDCKVWNQQVMIPIKERYIRATEDPQIFLLPRGQGSSIQFNRLVRTKYLNLLIEELKREFDCLLIALPSVQYRERVACMDSIVNQCYLIQKGYIK